VTLPEKVVCSISIRYPDQIKIHTFTIDTLQNEPAIRLLKKSSFEEATDDDGSLFGIEAGST